MSEEETPPIEDVDPLLAFPHAREAYYPERHIKLSEVQAHSLVDLVLDNPWLTDPESEALQEWSNYFFSNGKGVTANFIQNSKPERFDKTEPKKFAIGKGTYFLRPGKPGVIDLLRHHPLSMETFSNQPAEWEMPREEAVQRVREELQNSEAIHKRINAGSIKERRKRDRLGRPDALQGLDDGIQRIEKHTDFAILGEEIFTDPEKHTPEELQYALGLAGVDVINRIKARIAKGDKIAFMQVKNLTPQMHQSLHSIIEGMHGSVPDAISYILEGKSSLLPQLTPEERFGLEVAASEAREGARMLTHFKILSNNPDSEEVEELEETINNVLDNQIDVPYAYWRYTIDGYKGDMQVALASLGLGGAVALGLSAIGLGGNAPNIQELIKNGIKEGVPAMFADGALTFSNAYAESSKGQETKQRILETFKLLKDKYKTTATVGVAASVGLGIASRVLEQKTGSQILGALPLAATSIIPTWLTKITTESLRRKKTNQQTTTIADHPIQGSIVEASGVAAAATLGVGALRLLNNAAAVTGATEMVEPVALAFLALRTLNDARERYIDIISGNPQTGFVQTMKK